MNSFFLYIKSQLKDIKSGGITTFIYKLKKLFFYIIFSPFCIIFILFSRIISPFILIRTGPVRSDVIGASVQATEFYLSFIKIHKLNSIDFFYLNSVPPNKQWYKMIKREIKINSFFFYVNKIQRIFPGWEKYHVQMKNYCKGYQRDLEGIYSQTMPQISFSELENKEGLRYLGKIGLSPGEKYICLIIRDPAYKKKYFPNLPEDQTLHRNSNPDSYMPAVKYLLENGYWVFRMGKLVEKKLSIKHRKFFDYPFSEMKNDFLDIWINANCNYVLSGGTGLDEIQKTFRKPCLFVNQLLNLIITGQKDILSIFKKVEDLQTGKLLSLKEIIGRDIFNYNMDYQYKNKGIKLIENTDEEIKSTLIEFENRLKGNWIESSLYKELHNKYFEELKQWENYDRYHGKIFGKISETFLLNNKDWLFEN